MPAPPPQSPEEHATLLQSRWEQYVAGGRFEQFVEFAVAVNSLADHFNRLRLASLVRLCEGLEIAALAKLGDVGSHPLAKADISALGRQVDALLGAVAGSLASSPARRSQEAVAERPAPEWIVPRTVWIVACPGSRERADGLARQLRFFGFGVSLLAWDEAVLPQGMPLAVLFLPAQDRSRPEELARISVLRAALPASQLLYLGRQDGIESMVALMRAGIDQTIPMQEQPSRVLGCVLDLVQTREQEQYRVLVVEDSRVAVTLIERTLSQHGIDTYAIQDPGSLLDALAAYHPDLILMDMHMPRFNGIEATRVLRQTLEYGALPVVYLSSESDIGKQIEALRLGGDQFLMKPFNPVQLAAVVKTRIDRYRETLRSTQLDGLTGLLNHTAAKSRLAELVATLPPGGALTVAMIDIDHFKSINDTHGHPVGDQVIRGLAWLLRGRLRSMDLMGRYGGEEFLVALPGADLAQAHAAIDRIRHDFSVLPHACPEGTLHATFSAGLASTPRATTAAGLTEAADAALLQAKRLGRNRVETSA